MANVKISQLPVATLPLDGTDEIPVVQGGVTKRAPADATTSQLSATLAASGGAALIGKAGGGTTQDVATTQQIIVGTTHINVQAEYGVTPNGGSQTPSERTAALQNAFNTAPLGCVLNFPPGEYTLNDEMQFTRQMDLKGHGSIISSVPGSAAKSGIKMRIVEAVGQPAPPGATDCRGMRWEDLIFQVQGACLHGLDSQQAVGQSATVLALLRMTIDNCRFAVPDAAAGYGMRFGGLVNQKHIVTKSEIINGVYLDGCADGMRFEFNTVFGKKRAFLIDLAQGAFCTIIRDNILVARDGAMDVRGGSQIHFIGNQIEQGDGLPNDGLFNCSVLFYGTSYRQRGNLVLGNNFGGGENVRYNIVVAGEPSAGGGDFDLRDLVIDENTFNTASYNWGGSPSTPIDILIANDLVKYTRIGRRNRLRGVGSARGGSAWTTYPAVAANTLNDGDLLSVSDGGTGTYGAWKAAATLSLQNGYSGSVRYRKTEDDTLVFEGLVVSGTAGAQNAGTLIGTLPVGFRPAADTFLMAGTLTSGVGVEPCGLLFQSNGEIRLSKAIITADVRLSGVVLPIAGRASYSPGA
jgi:hypothetical protein